MQWTDLYEYDECESFPDIQRYTNSRSILNRGFCLCGVILCFHFTYFTLPTTTFTATVLAIDLAMVHNIKCDQ